MPLSTAPIPHSTPCQVRVQSASNTLKSSELHLLQAELRGNLIPNVDLETFVQNVLKFSQAKCEALTNWHTANHLEFATDWDRYLGRVSSSGGEPAIYDPLIELVHWIHNQVASQRGWQSGANLRFRNTWSRALNGGTASRKPDITGVRDGPHTSYPAWKEALVVWEVKHWSPKPYQELTNEFLLPAASAPRPFISDQSGLVPVSKKRAAPIGSLPPPPRKKSKSNSTSRNDPDTALDKGQTRETPLEQLLSYCLETMVAQPHRRYTIGLLLQDFQLQLVFHCRSFVATSKAFDIRMHRDRLLIVITALWIADLETLGFEKRFTGPDGLPALDPIGSSVSIDDMELEIRRLLYKARSLFGRASTALVAADKKNPTMLYVYVIKISCQAKTREPESAFLEAATNIPNIIRLARSANWGCMLEGFGEDFLSSIGQFEAREFRILVLSPVCELITTIDELSVFKTCFVKLVKAHRALFEEHVLHCDISIWNLMYDPITQEPYLIDADLGKSVSKLGAPSSNHRTGTLPFMAVDLLVHKPPPHMYRHDLESFFYVLVWICAEDHLGWHLVDSVGGMAKEKSLFLLNYDIGELGVKKFPELKASWIAELHRIFSAGVALRTICKADSQTSLFHEETLGGRVTYERFLECIKS